MCLTPLLIRNPNYNHHKSKIYRPSSWKYDTQSLYIWVPCGVCKQCVAVKQMYLVQRVQMEARNCFMFFSTLTYDNAHLPKVLTSTDYSIPFASYRDFNLFLKHLDNTQPFGRPYRYLACSERGSVKGRPHFHILWFFPKYKNEDLADGYGLQQKYYDIIKDYWSRNVGTRKNPVYEPLFTFKQKYYRGKLYSNYDTHFVVPSLTSQGIASVAFYVCKYLLKPSTKERKLQQALKLNLDEDEYTKVWNLVHSRTFRSSRFGFGFPEHEADIVSYLSEGVKRTPDKVAYPYYFSPDTGASFPLSPYYKKDTRILTSYDAMRFKMESPVFYDAEIDFQNIRESALKFEKIQNLVDSKDLQLDLNFLLDD